MFDISLTNNQKQYLLYLLESDRDESLPTISAYFNCSKVNSKKIIDRMVKIGLVYKEQNIIYLSDLGRHIAEENKLERDDMAIVLQAGLGIEKKSARELANSMLMEESSSMRARLLSMARYFVQVDNRQGTSLSSDEMAKILGPGVSRIYFVVFQEENHPDDVFVPLSMALRGIYRDVEVTISPDDSEDLITFRVKPIEEAYEGNQYSCKPKLLVYRDEGKERVIPIGEKVSIPFNLIKTWYYTGGGILQAALELCVIPDINIDHRHYAKFVFTINLFNLA
ncbi:hypothetical protein ACLGL1_01120 [Peptococcus simiae]|uniref:hypothetical protein n=1 Tax=Peptococcus simiae TaxID=1643805 RepID=UPI0039814675